MDVRARSSAGPADNLGNDGRGRANGREAADPGARGAGRVGAVRRDRGERAGRGRAPRRVADRLNEDVSGRPVHGQGRDAGLDRRCARLAEADLRLDPVAVQRRPEGPPARDQRVEDGGRGGQDDEPRGAVLGRAQRAAVPERAQDEGDDGPGPQRRRQRRLAVRLLHPGGEAEAEGDAGRGRLCARQRRVPGRQRVRDREPPEDPGRHRLHRGAGLRLQHRPGRGRASSRAARRSSSTSATARTSPAATAATSSRISRPGGGSAT